MTALDPELYRTLEAWCGAPIVAWVAAWAAWTLGKTVLRLLGWKSLRFSHHMVLSELPGLPIMLLHSVGFVLAIMRKDPLSAALFAWWGPGYLFTVAMVLTRGARIDWRPLAMLTSWGCKLSYVALMALYLREGCAAIPFAFSAWIMTDQVRHAWFDQNADRTRRTTEDFWIPRLLYPGLLLLPWFLPVPGGVAAGALGLALLALWIPGIAHVVRSGTFRTAPDPMASKNLRDIVYLRRGAARANDCPPEPAAVTSTPPGRSAPGAPP